MTRTLRCANIYDVLKVVALLAMTCDHIAFYLYPQMEWLRIIGRIAAPIFLLLVGYNQSFRFRNSLLIAAILTSVMDGVLIGIWIPQNILWTILIVRMVLHHALPRVAFHEIAMAAVVMIPLTVPFLDFGSFGLLFALIGYRLRQQHSFSTALWLVLSLVLFYLWTYYIILPDLESFAAVATAILFGVMGVVLWCAPYQTPVLRAPRWVAGVASLALYYYVGHKLLLGLIRLL
jgi:hypothetical protein